MAGTTILLSGAHKVQWLPLLNEAKREDSGRARCNHLRNILCAADKTTPRRNCGEASTRWRKRKKKKSQASGEPAYRTPLRALRQYLPVYLWPRSISATVCALAYVSRDIAVALLCRLHCIPVPIVLLPLSLVTLGGTRQRATLLPSSSAFPWINFSAKEEMCAYIHGTSRE